MKLSDNNVPKDLLGREKINMFHCIERFIKNFINMFFNRYSIKKNIFSIF